MASVARLGNIQASKVAFFLCDMQERFRPAINFFPDIVEVAKRLVDGGKLLGIPLIVTEQYPKGLGNTVNELNIQHAIKVVPKTKFSMVVPEVAEEMKTLCQGGLKHVVLFGIEAHVCIQQTVIDLLEKGYDVHVVADATSSRSQMDRIMAFDRFRHSGAIVTTSEALLLQLIGDKDHPKFKEIQGLIKISAPNSGLVPHL